MTQSISPYALLQASKPKPAPTVVTAYDLYSVAQSVPDERPQSQPTPVAADDRAPSAIKDSGSNGPQNSAPSETPPIRAASIPARRTHYISDIKTRHNAAMRRAALTNRPLT